MVDGGKKTLEPVGMKGTELKALVSFVVADTFFLDDVMARLRDMNITVSGFFSSSTGEAMLYLLEEDRDRTALLIDIGYLCTDVMAVEGDAVLRDVRPTFFENLTAMAFLMIRDAGVDIAVMEAGMGGRYDASMLCDAVATIITPIGKVTMATSDERKWKRKRPQIKATTKDSSSSLFRSVRTERSIRLDRS